MDGFAVCSFSNTASVFCTLQDKTAIPTGAKHLLLKSKLRLLRNIQLQPQPQPPYLPPRAGLYPLHLQQQGSRFLPAFISRHATFSSLWQELCFLSRRNCFRQEFRGLGDFIPFGFFLTPLLFCDFPTQLARQKNRSLLPTSS